MSTQESTGLDLRAPVRTRLAAAALAALGLAAGVPAHAETFALGVISSTSSFDIGNDGLHDWFADRYTFSVAEGSVVDLSGAVSSLFGRDTAGARNLWSDLYVGTGQFVRFAVGSTSGAGEPLVFEKTATYNPFRLGAGSYGLFVQGHVDPDRFGGNMGSYTGQLRFDVAAPVPEPESVALMLAGAGVVGWVARRRKKVGNSAI